MRAYVKPELYCETFELSQHIAVCGWDMSNHSNKNICTAVGDEGWGHFPVSLFTETPRCELTESQAEGYCYEVSSGAFGIFNS